jgi:hypothetical protein
MGILNMLTKDKIGFKYFINKLLLLLNFYLYLTIHLI